MIRAIVAIDERRGIGKDGLTPWNIPEDLKHFKELTSGQEVLMGEVLYRQFLTPLPDRRNYVASRSLRDVRPGFELVDNTDVFLEAHPNAWIIGGAGLYESTLQYCQELYVTHVQGNFSCDRFFPDFSNDFELVERLPQQLSEAQQLTYSYAVYRRKENR